MNKLAYEMEQFATGTIVAGGWKGSRSNQSLIAPHLANYRDVCDIV